MSEEKAYKNIFKTTFLFSFVQVFNILVKLVLNKIVALLLGAEGMGLIGIYHSTISLLKTGADLGVSQSAVRDISEANNSGDKQRFSKITTVTNKVILFTSVLGVVLTVVLSPLLSKWTLGNYSHTIAYVWLGLVVGLNVLTDGQLAILKGMRQLRDLAKASMIGSAVGLVSGAPMYYFFEINGIVPSLLITAFSSLFFSNYYVRKVKFEKLKLSSKQIVQEASPMVKMGIALMLVGFLGYLFSLIVSSYIRSNGGLEIVGYYQAGVTIIGSYFGIVISSMTTDYYPRISAVNSNNVKLQDEVNRQSEVGLTLLFPIVVLFVFLSPFFIKILYSEEFAQSIYYTDYAIIGTILIVCSNSMGMILLAKQNTKVFLTSTFFQRLIIIFVFIILYNAYGLAGLGVSYLIMNVLHFVLMIIIMKRLYDIKFSKRMFLHLLIVVLFSIVAILFRAIDNKFYMYLLGLFLLFGVCVYSYLYLKKYMEIDIIKSIKNMLQK